MRNTRRGIRNLNKVGRREVGRRSGERERREMEKEAEKEKEEGKVKREAKEERNYQKLEFGGGEGPGRDRHHSEKRRREEKERVEFCGNGESGVSDTPHEEKLRSGEGSFRKAFE